MGICGQKAVDDNASARGMAKFVPCAALCLRWLSLLPFAALFQPIAPEQGIPNMSDLSRWVAAQLGVEPAAIALVPVSGDAGFRRYYRLRRNGNSYVVMDASADRSGCEPFVRIDRLLAAAGLPVPLLHAVDLECGWLLLSDLGERTLLERIAAGDLGERDIDALYEGAIAALVTLQQIACPPDLPRYDEALLRRELALFPDWYLQRERGIALAPRRRKLLDEAFDLLVAKALAQPTVLVHRDYMPRNLMVPIGAGELPGLLDFQDAVCGPIAYDPICLFKDAFLSWPEPRVVAWLTRYWQRGRAAGLPLPASFDAFYADCDFIGAQRHLKVIGIFARLRHRDGKPKYLEDAPRFFNYLRGACARRAELAPLGELLAELAP
jgi:aminoglycoside/choline kinase family phosphotransferase